MPSPAAEETVEEPAWAEPAAAPAPLEAASVVELEAAAEEVPAAELAELVAAARLRVAAEAEVPVAVAEEGGSARARRHTRRREPGWSCASGSLRIVSRASRSASPAKAYTASTGGSSCTLDSGSATLRIGVFDSPGFHGSII